MSEAPANLALHASEPPEVALVSMRPVQLSVRNVGPFVRPDGMTVTFLGPRPPRGPTVDTSDVPAPPDPLGQLRQAAVRIADPIGRARDREPCNLWIAQGGNGSGKTTLLECIHGLFDLTSVRPQGIFGWHADGGHTDETAQLDLRVRVLVGGVGRTVLLSIWFGQEDPVVDWRDKIEKEHPWQVTEWARIGFVTGRTAPAHGSNILGRLILRTIRLREGAASHTKSRSYTGDVDAPSLLDGLRALPCCLLFGAGAVVAGRSVAPGRAFLSDGYRPAKRLRLDDDPDGDLLRTLYELAERPCGRAHLEEVLGHVREVVPFAQRIGKLAFHEQKLLYAGRSGRNEGVAVAWEGRLHPISMLGTGERTLLSLHVQALVCMTEATILLVDGIDRDIDPNRYRSVVRSLTELARRFPGLSIVATATDPRFVDAYDHRSAEAGIVKGGEILDWRDRP